MMQKFSVPEKSAQPAQTVENSHKYVHSFFNVSYTCYKSLERANLCHRYQIYIYEGAAIHMVVYRAGLENDDDMWGINPLTRIVVRARPSYCSLCTAIHSSVALWG